MSESTPAGPDELTGQAALLEQMLPTLMRRLFTMEPDQPVAELSVAQLRVCTILQSGARTLSALAAELSISVSAATQIVDRLERVDFVERVPSTDDRRTKFVQLAPHGEISMRARREARVRRLGESLACLERADRLELLNLVIALLSAATATAPGALHEAAVAVRQEQ